MVETRGGRRFAVFFFVAAFLVLLVGRWLQPVDTVAQTAFAPFAAVASGVSNGVGDTIGGIFNAGQLRSENQYLKTQNAKLVRELVLAEANLHDYALVKRMVKFEDKNSHMDYLPGRVIWQDPTGIRSYVYIDKGSRDGLREGMTVLDEFGFFVGSISRVMPTTSQVLLLENPSSSVGALDLMTRAIGVVDGNLSGPPEMTDVLTGDKVHVNDLIVTSGQMNLYPRNLVIGQVTRVSAQTDQLFQRIDVRPAADFRHLEIVQVIRNWVPSIPAQVVPAR